jgi:hypothetical protein
MFDASGIPYVLPYSNRRLSSCVDSLHKKNDENTIDFIDFFTAIPKSLAKFIGSPVDQPALFD